MKSATLAKNPVRDISGLGLLPSEVVSYDIAKSSVNFYIWASSVTPRSFSQTP